MATALVIVCLVAGLVLVPHVPPDDAPGRFIAMANERGGRDNITVVLVFVD